ncbi:hypothetical protein T492DRAFT_1149799 [Pavlovales sp. CCMP2436]|nr:hypothetical protein T492DRAFT_1149799 [Pavlovales sp. CCMP2436]
MAEGREVLHAEALAGRGTPIRFSIGPADREIELNILQHRKRARLISARGLCTRGRRGGTPQDRDAAPAPQPRTREEEARDANAQTCRTRTRKLGVLSTSKLAHLADRFIPRGMTAGGT